MGRLEDTDTLKEWGRKLRSPSLSVHMLKPLFLYIVGNSCLPRVKREIEEKRGFEESV